MCEALKELMAEEFQEVRDQVTEEVTEQLICNAYKISVIWKRFLRY